MIGRVKDEQSEIEYPKPGQYSKVPYAEAPWLSPPFSSPYYNESCLLYTSDAADE